MIRDILILITSIAAVSAITAALRILPDVSPTTAALALLLVVLAAATLARLRTAIVVSIITMLTLNFFFLPPVGRFTIADPQNWIALFAFLVVAIIGSNLSAAAHARTREAIASRNEVTRLFDLTRDVLLTTETTGAIDVLARQISRRFEMPTLAICLPGEHGWRICQGGADSLDLDPAMLSNALARARGTLEFDARQRAYGGHARAGARDEIAIVPLRQGTRAIGLLAAASPTLDIGTLDAVAGVAAIAIERAQFLAERDASALVRQKADLASTLLAALSHDLRTPLTAIRVAVENLSAELPMAERKTQSAAALTELDRLTRLFQNILDMARIDAAGVSIERQWVTAADIVDAALAHVRHAVDGHTLNVEAESDVEVNIDPRLTSVALSHVIENATRYSPRDRPIAISARVAPDGLHVTVTDQGHGLDPGELDHLFERFYRGRTVRDTTPGTGMGLSIARGLLNAAGGRIWAGNVPGAGARFSMVIPGAVRTAAVTS